MKQPPNELNQHFRMLLQMSLLCDIEGEERAVFLNADGSPNKIAYQVGKRINLVSGFEGMQAMLYALEQVPQVPRGDLKELEACWHGIGNWKM